MKIILMAAVTIDGKIARHEQHFVSWASREDRRIFVSTTKQAGVIIMGYNTYGTLLAPLKSRLHIVMTATPQEKEDIPGVVEFTDKDPGEVRRLLEARGFSEAVLIGGAQVNALFLEHKQVDEIWLTIEPYLFGSGLNLLQGAMFNLHAQLLHLEQLNETGTVFLKYAPLYE